MNHQPDAVDYQSSHNLFPPGHYFELEVWNMFTYNTYCSTATTGQFSIQTQWLCWLISSPDIPHSKVTFRPTSILVFHGEHHSKQNNRITNDDAYTYSGNTTFYYVIVNQLMYSVWLLWWRIDWQSYGSSSAVLPRQTSPDVNQQVFVYVWECIASRVLDHTRSVVKHANMPSSLRHWNVDTLQWLLEGAHNHNGGLAMH